MFLQETIIHLLALGLSEVNENGIRTICQVWENGDIHRP